MIQETVAILIVNGGRDPKERRWIDLCLDCIDAFTEPGSYRLYVWNNNAVDERDAEQLKERVGAGYRQSKKSERLQHFHATPLQRLYEAARTDGLSRIVVMDSDAHPVRTGWLAVLCKALDDGAALAGVWRDELEPFMPAYVHASCLAVDSTFVEQQSLRFDNVCSPEATGTRDTLFDFTTRAQAAGRPLFRLLRSNRRNFHRLMGGLYGGYVYHHGAGSRENILFWGEQDCRRNRVRNTLLARMSASLLMSDHRNYLAWLRGEPVSRRFMRRARGVRLLAEYPDSLGSNLVIGVEYARQFLRNHL